MNPRPKAYESSALPLSYSGDRLEMILGDSAGVKRNDTDTKNTNAPGEIRNLTYEGLLVEIRVLDFHIINTGAGRVPSFEKLSCLVTITETR